MANNNDLPTSNPDQIQPEAQLRIDDSTNAKKRTYEKPLLKKYGPLNRLTLFTSAV